MYSAFAGRVSERFSRIQKDHLRFASFAAAALILLIFSKASLDGVQLFGIPLPSFCAFRRITGFDCPGCGLTRSIIFALHGDFRTSYLLHLWGIPMALILLAQIPYRLSLTILNRKNFFTFPPYISLWFGRFLILSLLVPWIVKTIVVAAEYW
jgi:hypothetical protein